MHYYFASLTAAVVRGYAKNPKKVKASDFLLDFAHKSKRNKAPDEKSSAARIQQSKQAWFAAVGLFSKKKFKATKQPQKSGKA